MYHQKKSSVYLDPGRRTCHLVAHATSETKAQGLAVERISALKRDGVDRLKTVVGERISRGVDAGAGGVSSLRQIDILERARKHLEKSVSAMKELAGIELAAVDLQEAVLALGDLTGTTMPEEILDRIFGEFCIGK